MVGSAVAKLTADYGIDVVGKSSKDLDLTDRTLVQSELQNIRPDVLLISAARVGGIKENATYPVDFLSINLRIQTNLLDAAHDAGVKRVLFLGSSCIYPKFAPQPIKEEYLLSGPLESTNSAYAVAKIAGIKLVESYRQQFKHNWISIMPTNLYGPNDNFDSESAHVLPALINKFHRAKEENNTSITLWGDGSALREFLYVDDLAEAIIVLLTQYDENSPINVGSGNEISIRDLAILISNVVGYKGKIEFGDGSLNGTPRKLLDSSKISNLGWTPKISLKQGIEETYNWYLSRFTESRVN